MADIEKKLHTLARIAEGLNGAGAVWCVGASLLLYFHGIVTDFHDIDIMVALDDADAAERVLNTLGQKQSFHAHPQYGTKRFCEYIIDGVEVDMMAGFSIIAGGREHDCSLTAAQTEGFVRVEGQSVPLHSLGLWKRYYRLMGRADKVRLLADTEEK